MKTLKIILLVLISFSAVFSQSPDSLWKRADKWEQRRKPDEAIQTLDKIITVAEKKELTGDYTKAFLKKIILDSYRYENNFQRKITSLEKELDHFPPKAASLAKLTLAQWYWEYYMKHEWKIQNRVKVENEKIPFQYWDKNRFYEKCHSLYEDLLNQDGVSKITMKDMKNFWEEDSSSYLVYQNLKDAVLHRGAQYYLKAYQVFPPKDILSRENKIKDFLYRDKKYRVESKDEGPYCQALSYISIWLEESRKNGNQNALVEALLLKIKFAGLLPLAELTTEKKIKSLEEIIKEHPQTPHTGEAFHQLASVYFHMDSLIKADSLCREGFEKFPRTPGGKKCQSLSEKIREQNFAVRSNSTVLPLEKPVLEITSANIDKIHLKIYKIKKNELFDKWKNSRGDFMNSQDIKDLLTYHADFDTAYQLNESAGFKRDTFFVKLPPLKTGFYQIILSVNENFEFKKNQIKNSFITVSRLGLLSGNKKNRFEGFVLDNKSGLPLPNIPVTLMEMDSMTVKRTIDTDSAGYFSFSEENQKKYQRRLIWVEDHKGNAQFTTTSLRPYHQRVQPPIDKQVFYISRPLYRPGDEVRFKSVSFRDRQGKEFQLLAHRPIEVSLIDANGKTVSTEKFTTDEYGAVSGAFDLPRDRMAGKYRLSSQSPRGNIFFQVDEYQAPRFFVEFDSLTREARPGDSTSLKGKAQAYSGEKINQAQVRYTINRRSDFLIRFGHAFPSTRPVELAKGLTTTDSEGKFEIPVFFKPDEKIKKEHHPVFHYTVKTEITSPLGETVTETKNLRAAWFPYRGKIAIPEKIYSREKLVLSPQLHDLEGREVKKDLLIKIHAKKLKEDENSLYPVTPWWKAWEKDQLINLFTISAFDEKKIELKPGVYEIEAFLAEKGDTSLLTRNSMAVIGPKNKEFIPGLPFLTEVNKKELCVGDSLVLFRGGSTPGTRFLIEFLQDERVVKRFWTHPDIRREDIVLPIDSSLLGGFAVQARLVENNKYYRSQYHIDVPWKHKLISIKTLELPKKENPGNKIKARFKVDSSHLHSQWLFLAYDISLETLAPYSPRRLSELYRRYHSGSFLSFTTKRAYFHHLFNDLYTRSYHDEYRFPELPFSTHYGHSFYQEASSDKLFAASAPALGGLRKQTEITFMDDSEEIKTENASAAERGTSSPAPLKLRLSHQPQAFFFPHCQVNPKGEIEIEFQAPEAVSTWKIWGIGYDSTLGFGAIDTVFTTQKLLMAEAYFPKCLNENEEIVIPVKIENLSEKDEQGVLQFSVTGFQSARSQDTFNFMEEKEFSVPAGKNRIFQFPMKIKDFSGIVEYAVKAIGKEREDGVKGLVPVKPAAEDFIFTRAFQVDSSGVYQTSFDVPKEKIKSIRLELMANPLWNAVQALPLLEQKRYGGTMEILYRFFAANAAAHIAETYPELEDMLRKWKESGDLKSELEKHSKLKALNLGQTPWLRNAEDASFRKARILDYFNANHIQFSREKSLEKLLNSRLKDGSWPWFPGGLSNVYTTFEILKSYAEMFELKLIPRKHLAKLGNSIRFADNAILEIYQKNILFGDTLSLTVPVMNYLFFRPFWQGFFPMPQKYEKIYNAYFKELKEKWYKNPYLQSNALALRVLNQAGEKEQAREIYESLVQRSVKDSSGQRYWEENSLFSQSGKITRQSEIILALNSLNPPDSLMSQCFLWLLNHKRTNEWPNSSGTFKALLSILDFSKERLKNAGTITVHLGGHEKTIKIGPGQNPYLSLLLTREEIDKMENSDLKIENGLGHLIWGGLYVSYRGDKKDAVAFKNSAFDVETELLKPHLNKEGYEVIKPSNPIDNGTEINRQYRFSTHRDMDFIHIQEDLPAGMRGVEQISRYHYSERFSYYQTERFGKIHLFIHHLPKGDYLLDIKLRATHKGKGLSGPILLESFYAPEYKTLIQGKEIRIR